MRISTLAKDVRPGDSIAAVHAGINVAVNVTTEGYRTRLLFKGGACWELGATDRVTVLVDV